MSISSLDRKRQLSVPSGSQSSLGLSTTTSHTDTSSSSDQVPLTTADSRSGASGSNIAVAAAAATTTTSSLLELTTSNGSAPSLRPDTRAPDDAPSGDYYSAVSNLWPRDDDSSDDEDGAIDGSQNHAAGTPKAPTTSKFQTFIKKFNKTKRKYFLPPDEQNERSRIDIGHQLRYKVLDGRLHMAPASGARRVLDVGSGTGAWACDYARANPSSVVLGIDIFPVAEANPLPVPRNCRFQVEDAEGDWAFAPRFAPGGFDYIHVRSLGPFIDHQYLLAKIDEHLAPGGLAEFQEFDLCFRSANRSMDGTSLQKWCDALGKSLRVIGRDFGYLSTACRPFMEARGYERVTELRYPVPINEWAPDRGSKQQGALCKPYIMGAMHAVSVATFPAGLGWNSDEIDRLVAAARRDFANTDIHGFLGLVVLFVQKPRGRSMSLASLGLSKHELT